MDFRWGTSTSFKTVTKPHMKNNVVTTASATLLLEAGEPTALVRLGTFATTMGCSSRALFAGNASQGCSSDEHHTIARVGWIDNSQWVIDYLQSARRMPLSTLCGKKPEG